MTQFSTVVDEAYFVRVYFNRHQAAPLVWCVNIKGGPEMAVEQVVFEDVPVATAHRPKATPDDEDGVPSAWIEPSTLDKIEIRVTGAVAWIRRAVRP